MLSHVKLYAFWYNLAYRFGIHCATHQIRVILICALVITSLFYPALAGYAVSQPVSAFPSHWLDLIFPPSEVRPPLHLSDLLPVWQGPGQDTLRVLDDSATRARCGLESTIRVERLLVPPTSAHEHGVVNRETLLAALSFENSIARVLQEHPDTLPCVRDSSGECFYLSPLSFWNKDSNTILADKDLLRTINTASNVTSASIPVQPQMVFAARATSDHHGLITDFATYLVFTYFFRENDCIGDNGRSAWTHAINRLGSKSVQVGHSPTEPKLIALQFDTGKRNPRFSIISVSLYICYVFVFIHFSGSLRRMDTVHSRFGLAFTGIVEILVSTITSLSVCTLWGFRVTMVPWGILPIVIVFVGAENMFSIVEAVVSTSIALPVKERIAIGVRQAGTSNTLKVVTYNSVLGTIAFFAHGAIRQFCVFAIVVLVAHWFLIHTFFIAVLSIDLQRLELSELLRQGTMADSPTIRAGPKAHSLTKMGRWNSILRGRAARNGSLLVLLAFTAGLYYVTYPFPTQPRDYASPYHRGPGKEKFAPTRQVDFQSPAWRLWHVLNPPDDALVHLRLQEPSVIHLLPTIKPDDPLRRRPARFSLRRLRPLYWIIKIVILPIAVTISSLYSLLVYLLKGAEHLEAQRNSTEAARREDKQSFLDPIDDQVSFITLPRACAADIELVAATRDGSNVIAASIDNEVILWKRGDSVCINIPFVEVGSSSSATEAYITSVAIDERGHCAVGTGDGIVAIWMVTDRNKVIPYPFLSANPLRCPIISLVFSSPRLENSSPGPPSNHPRNSSDNTITGLEEVSITAVYENGTVVQWRDCTSSTPMNTFVQPTVGVTEDRRVLSLHMERHRNPSLAFLFNNGMVEIMDYDSGSISWTSRCIFQGCMASDSIVQLDAQVLDIGSNPRQVIGIVSRAGLISLWDGELGECIAVVDELYCVPSPLSIEQKLPARLRLSSIPPSKPCPQCREIPVDSFLLTFSVGQDVAIYRAFLQPGATQRRCECPMKNQMTLPLALSNTAPTRDGITGYSAERRSRSESVASSSVGTASPAKSRAKLPYVVPNGATQQLLTAPQYPVSSHGFHSRRVSNGEREVSRRSSSAMLEVPPLEYQTDTEEFQPQVAMGLSPSVSPDLSTESIWYKLRLVKAIDIPCERGGWDVVGHRVFGIRRRSRLELILRRGSGLEKPITGVNVGLSQSVLERWQMWSFDPSKVDSAVCASTLSSVATSNPETKMPPSPNRWPSSLINRRRTHMSSQSSSQSSTTIPFITLEDDEGEFPRLPFTRLSTFVAPGKFCVAGLGNTVGIFVIRSSSIVSISVDTVGASEFKKRL